MKKTVRINGGSEICRSVEKSLDEYFRRLDGEQPHGIYNMVMNDRGSLFQLIKHKKEYYQQ